MKKIPPKKSYGRKKSNTVSLGLVVKSLKVKTAELT